MDQKETSNKSKISLREEEIQKFWSDNKIFEKTLEESGGWLGRIFGIGRKKEFTFYDGPPFATGLPHYGHILASAIKDAVPRYKTMRGFRVPRRWGWDCHGLPIENIVEKDLHISGRKEIEKYGVGKFNEYARSKVSTYVKEWKKTVDRMGRWVDFDGSYKTMDNSYIESVWHAVKSLYDKGLIYEGTRVLPYCPRCETPIANSEIAMDGSYKDITDISVYVKFPIKGEKNKYLLAWTTTPWTLPGNFALAVNKDATYVVVESVTAEGIKESLILARDRLASSKVELTVVTEIKGSELVGVEYEPPFDYFRNKDFSGKDKAWRVYSGDFVTMTDGTGIVHIAPGYGEDDMDLAKKESIPFIHHVTPEGKFADAVVDFKGLSVKPKDDKATGADHQSSDIEIIKYLAKKGLLFGKEKIVHSYPHCYRCETPLFYYAIPAWFVKISGAKPKLLELNEKINWVPSHLKEGRFKKGLEGAPDWNISRNRFWASPLPIWKCTVCEKVRVVGSSKEIEKPSRNRFVVVRHGQSENNVNQVLNSDITKPFHLTKKGEEEAARSGRKLSGEKIDLIFTSPFLRTKETAEIIAREIGYPQEKIIFDPRIGEMKFGEFDGKTSDEYVAFFKKWSREAIFREAPLGAENRQDVKNRVGEFLTEIDSKYEGKKILIVSHEGPIWLMCSAGEGLSVEETLLRKPRGVEFVKNAEIKKLDFKGIPRNSNFEFDLHRPYSDSIELDCACGSKMRRISEVIDCWFESGSMPFASTHFPFNKKEEFKSHFPAEFVSEYIAQTRTWFYYMHVLSGLLFRKVPFTNVVTTGTILAEDGEKMSKSKGNFEAPEVVFDKYGADALRYYLLSSPLMKAEDLAFSERDLDSVYKKNIVRLDNVLSFYLLYKDSITEYPEGGESPKVLDIWIKARLGELEKSMSLAMEKYELDRALRPVADFIDDLSIWYLRRSRERVKGEDKLDKHYTLATLRFVLLELSKIIAPFTPFIAEHIYQSVSLKGHKRFESVHLESWPSFLGDYYHEVDIKRMTALRNVVSLALELRSKAGIKVRQPLSKLKIKDNSDKFGEELLQLIKDEVNVKHIVFDNSMADPISLDTTISTELLEEGYVREIIRAIQEERKNSGLTIKDIGDLSVETGESGKRLLEKNQDFIFRSTLIKTLSYASNLPGEEIRLSDDIVFKFRVSK